MLRFLCNDDGEGRKTCSDQVQNSELDLVTIQRFSSFHFNSVIVIEISC